VGRLLVGGLAAAGSVDEVVASLLFALGDGIGLQLLTDPEWDSGPSLQAGARTARRLLGVRG